MQSSIHAEDQTDATTASGHATRLREIASLYCVSRALHVAAELDIANHLMKAGKDVEALANVLGVDDGALFRLLRALAGIGVFEETAPRTFGNTALSRLLASSVPGSVRDLVLLHAHDTSWRIWEQAEYSVRTGASAFRNVYGMPIFDYLGSHPEAASMFDRAMAAASAIAERAVIHAYDFRGLHTLVDVAGGTGTLLCGILASHPSLHGIVFDLPHVATRARELIRAKGLDSRCTFAPGSFFDAVPEAADVYLLKSILHDWGDPDCVRILDACRRAARPDSKLVVCERLVESGHDGSSANPSSAKWMDLHMLVTTDGGRERSIAEFDDLFRRAGFRLNRVVTTETEFALLEAFPG